MRQEIVEARSIKTHPAHLAMLGAEGDPIVRASVARNPSTPADIVDRLAVDVNGRVRARAARHPKLDASVLGGLLGDPSDDVRAQASLAMMDRQKYGSAYPFKYLAGYKYW